MATTSRRSEGGPSRPIPRPAAPEAAAGDPAAALGASDRAFTCIGGVYRLFDEETGETIEVPVSVDLAAAIKDLDLALARREKLRKRFERSLSTLALAEGGEHDMVDPRTVASRHDGPRLNFTLLVGFGARWDGPRPQHSRCPCCDGAKLPAHAYCLRCDRSGRDDLFKPGSPAASPRPEPRPTRREPSRRDDPAATTKAKAKRPRRAKVGAEGKTSGAG